MSENIELTKPKKSTSSVDASLSAKNLSYVKINTIDLLIIHLSKYVAAYRKSYKFCGRVDFAIKISGGLAGSSALLALVPAIPIFVAFAGAVPVVLTEVGKVFKEVKFAERMALYKAQHRKMKELLLYIHKMSAQIPTEDTEGMQKQLLKEVFSKILENEKDANYITPMEMYMKEYKLNGY